jgi:hypothetical protein
VELAGSRKAVSPLRTASADALVPPPCYLPQLRAGFVEIPGESALFNGAGDPVRRRTPSFLVNDLNVPDRSPWRHPGPILSRLS